MKAHINKIAFVFFIAAAFSWISCSSDSGTSPASTDIVGAWQVSSIGSTEVNGLNSTWTFKEDGTYDWFILFDPFDLLSEGDYSLSGNKLTVTGFIVNVSGTNKISLTFSNNDNTFSWVDSDGERWVYNRIQ